MTLHTSELLSIYEKHPTDIFSVEIKFDFDTKIMLSIVAELTLEGIFFGPVPVELPRNKAEKKALATYFMSNYRYCSREEMPKDMVLRYKNYPDRTNKQTRAKMYLV